MKELISTEYSYIHTESNTEVRIASFNSQEVVISSFGFPIIQMNVFLKCFKKIDMKELIKLSEDYDKQYGGDVMTDFLMFPLNELENKLKNRKGRQLILVSDLEKLDLQRIEYATSKD